MNYLDRPKLSKITNEIHFFNEQGIKVSIEVGKRLEEAKSEFSNADDWMSWAETEFGYKKSQAYKLVAIAKRFHSSGNTLEGKTINEVYALTALTDEEMETPVQLPSGEEKKPIDMSQREIEQLKREKAEAERRASQAEATATTAQNSATHYEKLFNSVKNQPPRIETKHVEVVPPDYNDLKEQARVAQKLNVENVKLQRDLMTQKEQYEEKLSLKQKQESSRRDLQKYLSEQLRAVTYNHDSAVFNFIQGDPESHEIVMRYLIQYESIIKKQFAEWDKLTTIRAAN